jgi:hypothetical protein
MELVQNSSTMLRHTFALIDLGSNVILAMESFISGENKGRKGKIITLSKLEGLPIICPTKDLP